MAYIGQVCKRPVFHDLDLPHFQKQRRNQQIKIEIDKNLRLSSDFYRLLTEHNENLSRQISQPEFQKSLKIEEISEIKARKRLYRGCISHVTFLRELNAIQSNRFCYYVQNKRFQRETWCNSFHISHFHVCRSVLLVDVFSQLYCLTHAKKQQQQRTSVINF